MRRDRRVAIGRELPMPRSRNLETVAARQAELRHQPAGRSLLSSRDLEDREQGEVDAKQLEPATLKANSVALGIVDYPRGGDRPARGLRAALLVCDRAWRIDRVVERIHAVDAGAPGRRNPATAFQHRREVADDTILHRVGQLDIVTEELVALGGGHHHIASGVDLARLSIPDNLVGSEIIAFAVHAHFAGRGNDIVVAVVAYLVRAERDDLVFVCRRGGRGRCRYLEPRQRLRGRLSWERQEHGQRRPPDKFRPQRCPPALWIVLLARAYLTSEAPGQSLSRVACRSFAKLRLAS